MKFGVITFLGATCEQDVLHVLGEVMEEEVVEIWYKDADLSSFSSGDCIILASRILSKSSLEEKKTAQFLPITNAVIEFAKNGGYVWGIGSGFQVLCEIGLLPGTLLMNENERFVCKNIHLKAMSSHCSLTSQINSNTVLKIPIAHKEGRFSATEETLKSLEENDQILFQYCDEKGNVSPEANPNGSSLNIAGVCNENRNVFGMIPHPERAVEEILGNADGRLIFESLLATAKVEMAAM